MHLRYLRFKHVCHLCHTKKREKNAVLCMRKKESNKRLYTFNGAVWLYKTLVASSYRAQTRASSEKKARANIVQIFFSKAN